MNRKNGIGIAVWLALVIVTGYLAFGYGPRSTGYGPWQDDRAGPWNAGPSLFGGYGMGAGMTGGRDDMRYWCMPHGMMIGQGGMGSLGMGVGMMRGHPMGPELSTGLAQLPDLNAEQTQKITQLQRDENARNSQLAQQAWTAQDTLNRLLMNEKRDWDAIRAASEAVLELQRQQIDSNIDLQRKIDEVLTDSQREERARNWRSYGSAGAQ